jgi:hypothetical protein
VDDAASSRDFERQNGQPTDGVLPRAGETERRVDETADVHGEGTVDRVQYRQLREGLHHKVRRGTLKMLADKYVAIIAIGTDSPMIMKPRSTEAGPPFWKAPADPTKRPAPMAPPLKTSSQYFCAFLRKSSLGVQLTWQSSAYVCP